MKFLIVLVLAVAAQAIPDASLNYIADTPEVTQEKARFFDAYNRALASTSSGAPSQFGAPNSAIQYNQGTQFGQVGLAPPAQFSPNQGQFNQQFDQNSQFSRTNQGVEIEFTRTGHLVDTYEVSKSRAEHYRELARAYGSPTDIYDQYLSQIGAA